MALQHEKKTGQLTSTISIIIALVALSAAMVSVLRTPTGEAGSTTRGETAFQRTVRTKVLRVGYAGFPPYTITDVNVTDPNKRVSGFCIDLVNEIASRQTPPWKVEWHKASWESLRADMYSGKFDLFAEGIYQTVPRATEFRFSEPFSYFGVAVAVVRKDESRFVAILDLNKPGITISLPEGWTSTEYAREHLTQANLVVKPVGDDVNINFMDVVSGRADAALQDVPTVLQFVREHENEVKALWLDNPPLRVAAGFAARWEDGDMIDFINTCFRSLEADGTLRNIDQKWKGMGEYISPRFTVGAGIDER